MNRKENGNGYCRVCKYCGEVFNTELKHAKVCSECQQENHKKKMLKNLNLL